MITETDTQITVALKSCPFCGGKATVSEESRDDDYGDETLWCIRCDSCPAMMEGDGGWVNGYMVDGELQRLVTAWNHEPPVRAER